MRQEIDAQDARQGKILHHMRYVLGISLALVIAAFAAIYLFYFQ